MNDITEYVKNELCTFSEKPFSDLDSVCLSQMAYLFYDGLVGGVEECKKSVLFCAMMCKKKAPVARGGWLAEIIRRS